MLLRRNDRRRRYMKVPAEAVASPRPTPSGNAG